MFHSCPAEPGEVARKGACALYARYSPWMGRPEAVFDKTGLRASSNGAARLRDYAV
ncbi:MAG: hypothetical protein LBD67_02510 [Candidatus Accumulibacter sp.]|nr:hypothetical protein [Accumulibacter sp.]